jgi:hypothetical protein
MFAFACAGLKHLPNSISPIYSLMFHGNMLILTDTIVKGIGAKELSYSIIGARFSINLATHKYSSGQNR